MSDKNTTRADHENASEGLKIRKKTQQAEETPSSTPARQAAAPVAAAPVESAPKDSKPTLHRRVVDPKVNAPKSKQSPQQQDPLNSFESGTTEDFAALFESSGDAALPKQRMYEKGEKVTAPVTHIDSRFVYVDLGGRGEARAPRDQYVDEEGNLTLEIGKDHEFIVVGFGAGIELGSRLDTRSSGLGAIEDAEATGLPLMGRVTGKNKGGFTVDIAKFEAFCPVSQIDLQNAEELDVYVGQTFNFKVLEVRDGGKSVVVSRAAYLRDEQEKARAEIMEKLEIGAIMQGTVRKVSDFGAFVDLGGVDGLVHISEMSWSNVSKSSDVVSEGDNVDVKILSIEDRGGRNGLRIALSMKQVLENPWGSANERFHVGQRIKGMVVRTAQFGAFVEIAPGIDGLIHVSELSWEHVRRAEDVVKTGDQVEVEILDIDLTRQRISLSMKNVQGDPWDDVVADFPIASEVNGIVEKIEDFGAFINLGTITALLPRSEMNLGSNDSPHAKFRQGATITARVLSVEVDRRRMALTMKDAADINEQSSRPRPSGGGKSDRNQGGGNSGPRHYSDDTGAGGSFGTLGDLLKRRQQK
jgi:small subunit ribosomal protein S1